jgi:hypothetical protein
MFALHNSTQAFPDRPTSGCSFGLVKMAATSKPEKKPAVAVEELVRFTRLDLIVVQKKKSCLCCWL